MIYTIKDYRRKNNIVVRTHKRRKTSKFIEWYRNFLAHSLGISIIVLALMNGFYYAEWQMTPIAHAAPKVSMPMDNHTYCAIWKDTNEPVAGATKQMMTDLCNNWK
jgi:hypothetical protein